MELLTNRVKLPRIFDLCNREMRDHFRKCPTVWRGLWIPFGHGPRQLLEGSPRSWGEVQGMRESARLFQRKSKAGVTQKESLESIHHVVANSLRMLEGIEHRDMRWHALRRRRIVPLAECLYECFRLGYENDKSCSFL
jgi:hypothetical protein